MHHLLENISIEILYFCKQRVCLQLNVQNRISVITVWRKTDVKQIIYIYYLGFDVDLLHVTSFCCYACSAQSVFGQIGLIKQICIQPRY